MTQATTANEKIERIVRDVLADGVFLCVRLGAGAPIVDACRAAVRGGLSVLEITLTTPGALEAMATLARDDLRSLNGQIEYLLRDALRKRRSISLPPDSQPPNEPGKPA